MRFSDLPVYQPLNGYRFSVDPLILAAHVHPPSGARMIDAGCGCGIISLILGYRHPTVAIVGVDIQKDLADSARRNMAHHGMDGRVTILHRDIRTLTVSDIGPPADILVSNPPYRKTTSGRISPNPGRAVAHHEVTLCIDTLLKKAGELITPAGKLCIIFPASRLSDLEHALETTGFHPQWRRFVHFHESAPAARVIVHADRGNAREPTIRHPLYLYMNDGRPSAEHLSALAPLV